MEARAIQELIDKNKDVFERERSSILDGEVKEESNFNLYKMIDNKFKNAL